MTKLADLVAEYRALTDDEKNELGNILIEGLGDASWASWDALCSERDSAYRFLERWQDWNRQMHHELHLLSPQILPDDTKGRRVLAERLRAGVVAEESILRLQAERNQLAYECTLLAQAWLTGGGLVEHDQPIRLGHINALAERHYRPGELEPSGNTVPHPYRMTPELAAALSGLMTAEDPDPEHQVWGHADTLGEVYLALSKAVERVSQALRDQQPEIG